MELIWFILIGLFVYLWRQAEKKAEENYRAYDDLRQKLFELTNDRKTVSTKELAKKLDEVEITPQPQYAAQEVEPQTDYVSEEVVDGYNASNLADAENLEPTDSQLEADYNEVAEEPQIVEIEEIQQQLTPEEIIARKERATLRNLNIMLYMASFLLVAAAAAFVAAAMPEIIRLMGLVIVVALFYFVGMVLYQRAPRFKPAAVMFVGTGLAILPFVGVALTLLGGISGSSAWLITSAIGLVAYVYAAIVLQSQVVSYLSMAFVLSLVSSAVSAASLPTVWYFVGLIGVSLMASTLGYYKPKLLPDVFKKPIETTGQIVTPTALVASIFVAQSMTIEMYELLFGVSTAHYAVVWLQQRKLFYQTVVRVLAHCTLLIVAWDVTTMPSQDSAAFGAWWASLAIAQAVFSLVSIRRSTNAARLSAERAWLVISHIGLVISFSFWLSSPISSWLAAINLVLLGVAALVSGFVTRRTSWGYISLVASLCVPFVIGRGAADPQWPYGLIVLAFTVLAIASLATYWKQRDSRSPSILRLLAVSVVAYVLAMILAGILDDQLIVHGWSMVVAGAIFVGLSYASRAVTSEFIGSVLAAYGIGIVVSTLIPYSGFVSLLSWKLYAGFVAATLLVAAGAVAHQFIDKSQERRDGLVAIALVIFGIFAVLSPMLDDIVRMLSLLLTLAILLSVIGLRWLAGRDEPSRLRTILTVGYVAYLAIGWYVSLDLAAGWAALYYIVATAALWLASRLERLPYVVLAGNITVVVALSMLWQWLQLDPHWQSLCVGIVASGVLYISYTFYVTFHDVTRQWLMLASAWAVLVGGVYFGYLDNVGHQVVSVIALVSSVALLLAHKYVGHDTHKDSGKLTALVAVASVVYLSLAATYLLKDTHLAAWTFSIAAFTTIWLSYQLKTRWMEVFAVFEAVAAVMLFVGLTNLGDWKLLVSVGVSVALLAMGSYIHHQRAEAGRRNVLLAAAATVYALLVFNYALTESGIAQLSFVGLLTAAAVGIMLRWVLRQRLGQELQVVTTISYVVFVLLAWLMSLSLGDGWLVAASATAAIIFWLASYVEEMPVLLVANYIFVFAAYLSGWGWLGLSPDWTVLGTAWLSAATYYAAYWLYVKQKDTVRMTMALSATLIVLLVVPFMMGGNFYSDQPRIIASYATFIAAALVIGIHGFITKRPLLIEVGAYAATYGIQRIVGIVEPSIEIVWYVHWWSAVITAIALWRKTHVVPRLIVAMGLITLTVGLLALAQGGVYQLLFLAEHIILLVIGALSHKQWAVWWGIAASVAAILYFIKDYTYLWLGLLGLALIALVVWRLNKLGKKK